MVHSLAESKVEDAALAWLRGIGYAVPRGSDMETGELGAERSDPGFRDVILADRLRHPLNPKLPSEALEDAYRKLTRTDAPALIKHRLVAARRNA